MDQEQINELLKSKNDQQKVNEFIDSNLSSDQKNKLHEILSDKERLKSLLNSDRAKEILGRLNKD